MVVGMQFNNLLALSILKTISSTWPNTILGLNEIITLTVNKTHLPNYSEFDVSIKLMTALLCSEKFKPSLTQYMSSILF